MFTRKSRSYVFHALLILMLTTAFASASPSAFALRNGQTTVVNTTTAQVHLSPQLSTAGALDPTFGGSTNPSIFKSAWAAPANQIINPTVSAIDPASAPNDLDASVTITGTDFTTDLSGTPPTVNLGSVALKNVTWVDSTTLTATVPWGVNPGVYDLTMVNPDGGTGSLTSAFTVTQGIGQWNGGNIFGGEVQQILMKPGDPNTLYAPAYGIVGLFRSQDAAEHWTYVSADVAINNGKFAIDPLHPGWLYGFDYQGLHRSQDEGDTWTTLMPNIWPDGRSMNSPQVFVSPYNPQVLFVSSFQDYGNPYSGDAFGLIKSTDGGASWQIIADMEGLAAQDISFHPTDSLQMVLATSDARVFQSTDGGDTWSEVLKPPLSSLGLRGVITYNPYKPSEVWVASISVGIYKSTDTSFSSWQDVNPTDGMGAWNVKFSSADLVYITRHHSTDGGLTWQNFGPIHGYGEFTFDPSNPQTGYLGDDVYGVQKTTDGGQTWEVKSQGLTGTRCGSLTVSRADPLRVFAAFGGLPGIYRSDDGAINWTFLPIATTNGVSFIREDPFDPQRLYAAADGFNVSTDGGASWSDLGWNLPPSSPTGMVRALKADPFQAGHLLLGMVSGAWGLGTGWLYSSSDYGVTWQAVTMPQDIAWTTDIIFDPETPGLVYLTTGGTGVYRSTDSGNSWTRIDDQQQPDMQYIANIAIATHPQHVLFVSSNQGPYRSFDGGATWEKAQSLGGSTFIDGDSTRLYAATGFGLFFSSDVGDSWEPAAGTLGQLQIMALGYAVANDHTILYAATSGGAAGTASSITTETPPQALATASNLVDAGIYRYVSPTFTDVPFSYWANTFIERLYNAGITGGCSLSPLMYCPETNVNRAQMAVFLLRGEHGSTYIPPAVGTGTGFTDVPADYWAAAWIKQLAAEGITSGCGPSLYCPETSVTRDQMAVFLLRAEHGASYTPPPATGVFTDVPTTHWAAPWIEQLAAEGITGGCGVDTYCPSTPVTRAQMAVFLVRTFNLP